MNWWMVAALFLLGVVGAFLLLFVWALMATAKRADDAAEAAQLEADGIDPASTPTLLLVVNHEPVDLDAEAAALYRRWKDEHGD